MATGKVCSSREKGVGLDKIEGKKGRENRSSLAGKRLICRVASVGSSSAEYKGGGQLAKFN